MFERLQFCRASAKPLIILPTLGVTVTYLYSSCGLSGEGPGLQRPETFATTQSLMDPHALPERGPWFEGWYARFSPADTEAPSVGVVVGSILAPGASGALSATAGLPGFVSVLVSRGPDYPLQVLQARVSKSYLRDGSGRPVNRDPLPSRRASFSWVSDDSGLLSPTEIDLRGPEGWRLKANVSPPTRVSWDSFLGPAGPASLLRFLPLQWYVYGQDLAATWQLETGHGEVIRSDSGGRAHFEKNWGRQFPAKYIWLQGLAARGATNDSIVAAGGHLGLSGPAGLEAYLVVINQGARRFVFSPVNGALFSRSEVDACRGSFRLKTKSVDGELTLTATAPRRSFGTILIPTGQDFEPKSEQSFDALLTADIRTPSGEQLRVTSRSSALEFGGGHKCPN